MRSRWLAATLRLLLLCKIVNSMPSINSTLKINPKPCTANGYGGTCMFVWECIKSEGQHIGMCVDSFMFGSCCAYNVTENMVPTSHHNFNFKPIRKPRPPPSPANANTSHRPNWSATTTVIHRPHGDSMLVIRPSVHKKNRPPSQIANQHFTKNPVTAQASITTTTTTTKLPNFTNTVLHLETAASSSTGLWSQDAHTTQWQVTTQPNFVTKLKPTQWEKVPSRIKPKPTKKPIASTLPELVKRPTFPSTQPSMASVSNTISQSIKPKPTQSTRPAKPTTPITTTVTKTTTTTTMRPLTTRRTTTQTPFSSTIHSTSSPYQPISSSAAAAPIKLTTTTTAAGSAAAATILSTRRPPTNTTLLTFSTDENNVISSEATMTDLLSPADSNDISEENLDKPKRSTVSAAKSADCGISTIGRPEIRIVGGKNAPFGRWPWQVSVRRTSFFGFSSTHRCGGAIINENWIATAGHCVDDLLTSQIRIRVGEYDFSHIQEEFPYVERAVARKVVHPKYNFFTYEFDLALVQLESPLEFAPHIAPICLPATDDLLIGRNATVTGWGRLSEGGTLPSVLQEVQVPIVSNDRCKMMFLRAGRHEFIPDIFLCAGHDTGGHDSCQGDSGGPLQVKGNDGHYFLAGIISWGIGCAEANLPGVCTRISKFTPWILNIVK